MSQRSRKDTKWQLLSKWKSENEFNARDKISRLERDLELRKSANRASLHVYNNLRRKSIGGRKRGGLSKKWRQQYNVFHVESKPLKGFQVGVLASWIKKLHISEKNLEKSIALPLLKFKIGVREEVEK